jgi:Polysaccharide deacetylase
LNAQSNKSAPGLFVVSLDFELYWGLRHLPSVKKYFRNLEGARAAIPAILEIFNEYDIHATWAIVGFLFFDQTRTLLDHAPKLRPCYHNRNLYPYDDLPEAEARDGADSIFFAPSLIRRISDTRNQEIATHSFSHYYCLERGQDIQTFREDLRSARITAEAFGVEVRSLVFPKNQCRTDYLSVLSEVGIGAYRGNRSSWLYRAAADGEQGMLKRLARLLDSYIPLSGPNCSPMPSSTGGLPINIVGSRFLRPYSPRLRMLEPLRIRRIKRDLTLAARAGQLYHLWWHPHNFGVNLASNLCVLRQILDHFRLLRDLYGMESLNMNEVATRALATA